MRDGIKILQERKEGKTDSIFYSGDIATYKKENGTVLYLIATGDIRVNYKDEFYNNGSIEDFINEYVIDDDKLLELENEGVLKFENNNWFEVTWVKRQNKDQIAIDSIKGEEQTMDFDIGEVEYDYDSAISLLESYIDNEEI